MTNNSTNQQAAIDLFNLALELPGNGAYRLSGSPREYACPSDAEEHAALYNMACCYAQMGQKAAALTCLESILESGGFKVECVHIVMCGGGLNSYQEALQETQGMSGQVGQCVSGGVVRGVCFWNGRFMGGGASEAVF